MLKKLNTLKELIFYEYAVFFKKMLPYYYEDGILNEKTEYFNLNSVIEHILHYKSKPTHLVKPEIKKEIVYNKDENETFSGKISNVEYISLKGILKLIIKRNNDYRICNLHIKLGLADTKEIQGLCFISSLDEEIEYTPQTIFTFTIFKHLTQKHNIHIITEYDIIDVPYRCDIFIENLDVIIEFYENWHKTKKNHDGLRQEHIQGLGYEIKVFKENETNIKEFVNELDYIIENKKLLNDKDKEDEYIINVLISGGCDKTIAKEMYEFYKIGDEYKLDIRNCMLLLGFGEDEEEEAIKEFKRLVEKKNYIEKDNTIKMNSYGFKFWLLCSNSIVSHSYKEYYIHLENICIKTLKNTRAFLLERNKTMRNTTGKLLLYAKKNADKDLIKQNKELKEKIDYLEKLNKNYETAHRYIFKKNLLNIDENKELEEDDIILVQIPELKFTKDNTALIQVIDIRSKLQVNNMTLRKKDRICPTKAIEYIKKKLGIDKISLYNNSIPHCKLIEEPINNINFDIKMEDNNDEMVDSEEQILKN
jgi:hypothetical protein